MPDCIQAQITANIKAALRLITISNGYNYNVAAVEEARKILEPDGRFPYILLLEEEPIKDDENLYIRFLEYTIWFFSAQNDEVSGTASTDLNSEIAYYNRNAIADITRALNVGDTGIYRDDNAEITEILPGTHSIYMDEGSGVIWFGTWCKVLVTTSIDATDPYQNR